MTADLAPAVRALLADGRVAHLRQLEPADEQEVLALHQRLSSRDRYLRFFTLSPASLTAAASSIARPADEVHAALGAYLDGALVGVANYEVTTDQAEAEVALAVDGTAQAHGVGTLLLEHLVAIARGRGLRRFVAEVLADNGRMLRVFQEAGLACTITGIGPEHHVQIRLDESDHYLATVAERERHADVASLRALLRPRSVVVIGAGRSTSSVGNAVLRNLRDGGFTGALYAVNPHATEVAGVPSHASVDALPHSPDLAVVCLPAAAVPDAVEACGRRGVKAAVVISAGLSGTEAGTRLLAAVREHGMRMVGPNCIGIGNTDPTVSMNATFVAGALPRGRVGVVSQSGGVGVALVESLRGLGLGLSTLVSTGDKYDVSGNDLLRWWQHDPDTDVAVLYLESFGNPRKFARTARALASTKPVVAVRPADTEVAQQAAASHTAAAATPAVTRDALFEQAGVIAVDGVGQLVDVLAALSWSPLPRGDRVAVLSNAGGEGVLAADACVHNGLTMAAFSPTTTEALRALLSDQASVRNPVDTTATVTAETFVSCLRALLDDDGVDAVIAAGVPTALGNPLAALAGIVAPGHKPVLVVAPGQLAAVTALGSFACYADPTPAAAALAAVSRYALWRREPGGGQPELAGIAAGRAERLVREVLDTDPDGGWLDPPRVSALLDSVGIAMVSTETVTGEQDAVLAATRLGYPVVLKAVADGVLHKSAAGGVLLDLRDEDQVRGGYRELAARFGGALRGAIVQHMAASTRELIIGVSSDELFGPLVVYGLGGTDTDLIADRTARLTPLSTVDAERMLHGLRCSPALLRTAFPREQVVELLLRVGRLAELVPEIVELDLNPVAVTPDGCQVLDARIRLRPTEGADPFVRRLRI